MPTLVALLAAEFNDTSLRFSNTQGKVIGSTLKNLRSAENLLFTIGLMHLLELHAAVSLEAQHSFHFPVKVWDKISNAKEQLSKLSEHWSWNDAPLKLGGIGSPTKIIQRLADSGEYTPNIPEQPIRKHLTRANVKNCCHLQGKTSISLMKNHNMFWNILAAH